MIDLTTHYLGLPLKNPLIPSSCPLTNNITSIKRLEDNGASAIVLPSLFEEELIHEQQHMARFLDHQEIGHHEADSFLPIPDQYSSHLDKMLSLISQCKESLEIPVIGSINGITPGGWVDCAIDLQEAGCDAIELNLYSVEADGSRPAATVENDFASIVDRLYSEVTIPITVKLSSQFSSLSHFALNIEKHGAAGIVCFNRFYQPDIDLDTLQLSPTLELSSSIESLVRIRWIALLRSQLKLSLAATGGFHRYDDVAKALLVGADAIYLCSVLMNQGAEAINNILADLTYWMEQKEYQSVEQLKGSLSYQNADSPALYARGNYLEVMDSFTPSKGVKV
ncbi:dihydroorotate dehydrogenase-like protein [Alkalimarinus sediminis]|uniref:Dihydroorotate dehydrogenase-like protein n=1 Tax=Alkalimarinus sediminis TaxID=1632866 RepID=A0A9E8KRD5_9ALTE|nr:dihydroorotate dehydrogenase-like protein [Alkalimarinus sediminis]UZW76235.1 dihydroorotate dehydrogenase-like protein [Alkalimarinus sediminis]